MARTPPQAPERDTKGPVRKAAGAGGKGGRQQADKESRAEQRRQEILHAAFDAFAENGFAQTRLEDVARRAGIAKGTIYLYFPDKESLFVDLLREAALPVLGGIRAVAALPDLSVEEVLRRIHEIFFREILSTRRKHLLRLLLQEGARFPAVAEFYYHDIVSHGLEVFSKVARRAQASGELTSDALARFPQLVMAPLLMSVIWDALFEKQQHLDVEEMLAAFRALVINPDRAARPLSDTGGDPR
ncbi:TetR/AcrR family transcriptional regulator [Breoghania sp. JC706]|uniref:TetR/AcrR family transcriptional regulator n=1 Tax=Breoghania sp. JC706 TaxID=3117732 RepID=UPI00300AC363